MDTTKLTTSRNIINPGGTPIGDTYDKAVKTPIFSISLTQRPHFFLQSHPKTPYFFTKLFAVTQSPHFFRKIEILTSDDAQFL